MLALNLHIKFFLYMRMLLSKDGLMSTYTTDSIHLKNRNLEIVSHHQ